MRAFLSRAALVLTLLQASCLLSSAQLDQGDHIVKIVKDSLLQEGGDWRRALAEHEESEAVTSHETEDPATAHMLRRLSARRSHEVRGSLEARHLAGLLGGGMANSKSKSYKKMKMQAKGFGRAKATSSSDKELTGPKQKNCAWQAFITGRQYNVAYPDTQAVYQVLVMLNVNENHIFRIKGKFPTKGVKYFSLQSNNPSVGYPVTTLKDFEIEPDAGSGINPFRDDAVGTPGTYTLYVTPTGKQTDRDGKLLPNQLALCPEGTPDRNCRKMNAVMLMRFYTSDPDREPANSNFDPPASQARTNGRLWGYENMAVVEERVFNKWKVFAPCDQSRPTAITSMIMDHFSTLIPPFAHPVRHNKNDNFIMYLGEATANAGVYPNLDAAYLLAMGYDRLLPAGTHMVARVTATLPTTPRNLVNQPKIANYLDYDVRYASFSTLGLVQGGPTADTLDDASFIRFYGDRPGWEDNRTISFVVAPDRDSACGIFDPEEDLFLTTKISGVAQDYWGILYRQLIPKFLHTGEPDKSNGYAQRACSAMADNDACVDPQVLESIQGDHYPHITFWTCSESGVATQVTEKLAKIAIGTVYSGRE